MKEFSLTPAGCSMIPIAYDSARCIGCNRCVDVCQCDVLMPHSPTPQVAYPGECCYCGACVMVCPREGTITLRHPLMNQAKFVDRIEKQL